MWRPVLVLTVLLCSVPRGVAQPAPAAPPAELAAPAAAEVAPTLGPETLQSFDYNRAELQWSDRRWQLAAGGVVLKDFGRREADAREALRVLRELRLTQRGTVGTPQPVMEYWLTQGQAPQSPPPGVHPLPLDAESLRVEQVQGQWWVRDNSRPLFDFGSHADEARQAVAVLRHYGFTRIVSLGRPSPEMLVFLGGAGAPTRFRPTAAASPFPGRAFPPAHEPGPGARQTAFPPPPKQDGGVVPALFEQPAAPAPGRASSQPADLVADADRVPIDARRAQVKREDDDWKLVVGNYTLANFGPHDDDARLALAAVRYYHFTEHGSVGRPRPLFSYFLVNGQAPRGYMMGLQHLPFRPDGVTVRQDGEVWRLVDGGRPLLDFGDHPDEARQALQLIQRYQFDTLCRVGHADSGALTFFVRAR